jgi:uncharacterized protein (DUF2141 family)
VSRGFPTHRLPPALPVPLRGVARLALVLALASGCAKKGPPSGGPPDLTPPRVIETHPDSGRAAVPLDAVLSLTFSEGMEPRSTNEAVSLAPVIEIRRHRWSGRTLSLELAHPLEAGQTYTLFVAGGARDLHGNPMPGGSAVVFSTADSFPRGRIDGHIDARGFAAVGTALWCYEDRPGHVPDSTARDFDAIGLANEKGNFRVDGLAVPGRYRLWAFADLNGNHSFEPEADVLVPADTSFALDAAHPTAGPVLLHLVNPRAPGVLSGAVLDTLGDSLGVRRIVAVADSDTSARIMLDVDVKGGFELQLKAGRYRIRAFRDLDKNKLWNPDREPASEELLFVVEPAAQVKDLVLVLRRPRGVP